MTKVAILPVPREKGGVSYHAVAGDVQAEGNTAGEALDALTPQLSEDDANLLVIVQRLRPDRFFTAVEQLRLEELMTRWRAAREGGHALPPDEQAELEVLTQAELHASAARAAALADELGR